MDVLSDVLNVAAIGSRIAWRSELTPPWGLAFGEGAKAAIHVVQRGECWLRLAHEEPRRLLEGDIVFVAPGVTHELLDSLESIAVQCETVSTQNPGTPSASGTALLCAAYSLAAGGAHPLTRMLPPVIHLNQSDVHSTRALASLVDILAGESHGYGLGSEFALPKLVDALFVLVLRTWLTRHADGQPSWMSALGDPIVGPALAAIHDRPAEDWTIEKLARTVSVSRATLARQFASRVGESPHGYLVRWRLGLAARLLEASDEPVATIAATVGYQSAPAFTRAFSNWAGVSPSGYRSKTLGA